MHIFLCSAAFVLLAKRAQSEEVHTNLEFVFLMWQHPTEFDAVATPFTQNDTEETTGTPSALCVGSGFRGSLVGIY